VLLAEKNCKKGESRVLGTEGAIGTLPTARSDEEASGRKRHESRKEGGGGGAEENRSLCLGRGVFMGSPDRFAKKQLR